MATTSPDGIGYITTSDNVTPATESASQATTIQAALLLRQRYEFVWANTTARTAQAGMVSGSTGYQLDTKSEYIYENSAWRLKTPHAEFTSSVSAANGSVVLLGTFTLNTSVSTSSTFVTPVSSGIVNIVDPGIYGISTVTDFTASVTATSYASMYIGGTTLIQRVGVINGLGQASLSIPNLRVIAANTQYTFDALQQTGGTRTVPSTLRVTRLG